MVSPRRNNFEAPSEEYQQTRFEQDIREQCSLHGWAAAITVANPVDILIMFEDEEVEQPNSTKGTKA
jgi:hypothetical protein